MTNLKRIHANRENARHSTGPRTARGKENSKMNALKHGMRALTPVLPGEDAEEYERLRVSAHDHYNAGIVYEEFMVDRHVNAAWKVRRAERLNDACLRRAAAALARANEGASPEPRLPSHKEMKEKLKLVDAQWGDPRCKTAGGSVDRGTGAPRQGALDVVEEPTVDPDALLVATIEYAYDNYGPRIAQAERYYETAYRHMKELSRQMDSVETMRERLHKARLRDITGVLEPSLDTPGHRVFCPRLHQVPHPEHIKPEPATREADDALPDAVDV